MRVDVYWNLHKKCWSVKHKGKVVKHLKSLVVNNAKLVVQPAGREKVLREKRKNVHAFVRGDLSSEEAIALGSIERVRYNPYLFGHFFNSLNEPIFEAPKIHMTEDGKCFQEVGSLKKD